MSEAPSLRDPICGTLDDSQGSLAASANYSISFSGATLTIAAADNSNAIYLPIATR